MVDVSGDVGGFGAVHRGYDPVSSIHFTTLPLWAKLRC